VATNEWDYRTWSNDYLTGYTNFLATAGVYDREVGLGGFIRFHVYDDDDEPPRVGANTVLKVGPEGDYTDLAKAPGEHEVVFTAWSFTNNTSVEACAQPWGGSLFTNAYITWTAAYSNQLVDPTQSGTGVNDVFDGYSQVNRGALYMRDIGTWGFNTSNVPWIQFELPLIAGEDITMSWAETGGARSFTNVSLQWSLTGEEGTFATNAAWPPWTMTDASSSVYRERFVTLSGVVPDGAAKVYLRFVLGPGWGAGGSDGSLRMDNIQIFGRPEEFIVTDGQIADSEYTLRIQGNVYDTASGLQPAQATMKMGGRTGVLNPGKAVGDGKTEDSTLWWDVGALTRSEVTDLVRSSETGAGIPLTVDIPDADADRPNDVLWFSGSMGRMRVVDDDTDRPRLTLASMRPRRGILAQWLFTTTNSLLATRADGSVEASRLMAETLNGATSTPRFVIGPTGGTYAVRQSGWHYNTKYWKVELTPEADMAITNINFMNMVYKTNGPTHFWIRQYINGVSNQSWGPFYITGNPAAPTPATNVWYSFSSNWPTNSPINLPAGQTTEIRIHGMGGASNSIGTYWGLYNLTFLQGTSGTNGITEVTDAEFASGSFRLQGSTWDDDSGIRGPASGETTKRPMFSLNRPDGLVLVTNQPFTFTGEVTDGGARTSEEGAFHADLPQAGYTNLMLGEYLGHASAWDFDDDRTDDDLQVRADLAMYIVDNDVTEPTAVGTLYVNGNPVPETAPDRFSVTWTNRPEFVISFSEPAHDPEGDESLSEKQRASTGIGEYRVSTNTSINSLTASNRAFAGRAYPVATTNGALANYGFEFLGANLAWTLGTGCSIQYSRDNPALVREGTNSLLQTAGAVAHQTIEFLNQAGTAPAVAVNGLYRSSAGATFRVEAFATNDLLNPLATHNLSLPATGTNWSSFNMEPVEASGNLGFEAGDFSGWLTFGDSEKRLTVFADDVHSGAYGAVVEVTAADTTWNGIYRLVPVQAGSAYEASVYIRAVSIDNSSSWLEVKWLDASGGELSVDKSAEVQSDQGFTLAGLPDLVAPAGAVTAHVGVAVWKDSPPDTDYHVFDDFHFGFKSGPAMGDATTEVLKISLVSGGGTTYWDDLRLSVDIGTNLPSMRFVAGVENQGLIPQYLFAVDADNNRHGDRLGGEAKPFYVAYDVTPPTVVGMPLGGGGASTDEVDDPTTQFDVTWYNTNVGPDDPVHDNHPTKNSADRDLLSPWGSYKIYYGSYTPLENPPANYIYDNFIATGDYTNWPSVQADTPIADPSAASYQPNYQALTNLSRQTIRLYDLDFDQDYAVVIVGVDKAGNEGPAGANSWATNNTIKFSMTRGWTMPKSDPSMAVFSNMPSLSNTNIDLAACFQWTASGPSNTQGGILVTKDYDLIYWDSGRFFENTNNNWRLVGTVRSNWFADDGGFAHTRGQLRFYRASYAGRWRRTNDQGVAQRPLVSEEVYAQHNVLLSAGQNFVALHGVPYTNTFDAVFGGTDVFPGGGSAMPAAGATVIEFYSAGTNAPVSDKYWLSTSGQWIKEGSGENVTTNLQSSNFFTRGFSINLPPATSHVWQTYRTAWGIDANRKDTEGQPLQLPALIWAPVAQVPTNGFSQVIQTGSRTGRVVTHVYNLVALRLPVSAHPGEMQLVESGFVKGAAKDSDQIYTLNTATKTVLSGSTLYCDENDTWRFVGGGDLVPPGYFKPNDVIVIVSKNRVGNGSWTWTYHPEDFYSLPNRWMESGP
jgi:hypothetical protein